MPAIAILTFGRFTLCRAEQEIAPPGRQGDTLCKALLCQPGRQAESAWLLEHLWPEAEGDLAVTYLHNAAWSLRQSLPAGMLLTHKATQSYQLAGQDQLWVDADAALARIAEADTLGRATAEALPRLEQAVQYFRRGRYLAGVEETWVQARRIHIETMKERAFTWLVEVYRTLGKLPLAEALLAEALAEDPTNENLLCALMQILHEAGMTHQALRAYETFMKALKKAGLEPAEMTTALYERLKHAPRSLALPNLSPPARQAKRVPLPAAVEETENRMALVSEGTPVQQAEPLFLLPGRVSRTAWASRNHHQMPDLLYTLPVNFFDGQDLGAYFALSANNLGALLERGWSIEALLEVLQVILPIVKAMPMMTRRAFLHAGVATALLGGLPLLDSQQVSEEEVMQFCQAFIESIAAGWRLFTQGKNAQALAVSQAQLALLQHMSAALPVQERPSLYASIYDFLGMALHSQKLYHEALKAHNSAYLAALGAGDTLGIAHSLLSQADNYRALRHYQSAIGTLEQAQRTLGVLDEPPLHVKAHLLDIWADCAMTAGDFEAAPKMLDAIATLLDDLRSNEAFDRANWYMLTGKYAGLTGDDAAAAHWCEQAWQQLPQESIIRRALVLMPWLSANVCMRDLEASLMTLEKARQIIPLLDAPFMYQPLLQVLQQGFLVVFPHETRVKTIVSELMPYLRVSFPRFCGIVKVESILFQRENQDHAKSPKDVHAGV